QGVGEQVWTASLSEQVDDLFASGGVAAGCAAQCFAQGAGDDVNTALNAAVLCGAASMFADKANRVAVVNHNQRVVFVCQVADALQVADDAVHREDTVGRDQFDSGAGLASLFQFGFQVLHVVVFVSESLCFAKTDAVDDRSV